jgi:hypothetical protein
MARLWPLPVVDSTTGAVRMTLGVTTDSAGKLGFTMSQPDNIVLKLRPDAPCATEGMLREEDVIEAIDGVAVENVASSPVPNLVKSLLITRYDRSLANTLRVARPHLVNTMVSPTESVLKLLTVRTPLKKDNNSAIVGFRVKADDTISIDTAQSRRSDGPADDDMLVGINGMAVDVSKGFREELARVEGNGKLSGDSIKLLVVRGLGVGHLKTDAVGIATGDSDEDSGAGVGAGLSAATAAQDAAAALTNEDSPLIEDRAIAILQDALVQDAHLASSAVAEGVHGLPDTAIQAANDVSEAADSIVDTMGARKLFDSVADGAQTAAEAVVGHDNIDALNNAVLNTQEDLAREVRKAGHVTGYTVDNVETEIAKTIVKDVKLANKGVGKLAGILGSAASAAAAGATAALAPVTGGLAPTVESVASGMGDVMARVTSYTEYAPPCGRLHRAARARVIMCVLASDSSARALGRGVAQ